jgi:hypothetical protein
MRKLQGILPERLERRCAHGNRKEERLLVYLLQTVQGQKNRY